jgi:hypothetical protein
VRLGGCCVSFLGLVRSSIRVCPPKMIVVIVLFSGFYRSSEDDGESSRLMFRLSVTLAGIVYCLFIRLKDRFLLVAVHFTQLITI